MYSDVMVIGPLLIPVFRLSLVVCLFLSIAISGQLALKIKGDKKTVKSISEYTVWVSLISARLGFVVLNWSAYSDSPWTLLYFWQPGYHLITGVMGGLFTALFLIWRTRASGLKQTLFSVAGGFGVGSVILATLLLVSSMDGGEIKATSDNSVLDIGDQVPDFNLNDLQAKSVSFSDYNGDLIVLNFWATWCAPCRREMPTLNKFYMDNKNSGVTVVGINVGEDRTTVASYIRESGILYPILIDSPFASSTTDELLTKFGGIGLPTTLIIDRNGKIRDRYVGELSAGLLVSWKTKYQ